ncbi:hypothetical protein [Streptomyces cylindrosporus]|uniref:Uncharacterized protein n=1 Tax=Streptomyces cylindrosporus TaxID=2927583 RepID=A0ABS9YPD0_9ACTN|nr:hypothetical protein [Streptomyces cylindrosporus]MCI3279128.1 hypothetical protein [Streptomyces cylindrosporus]
MTENHLHNDRFPTDPRTLMFVITTCAALSLLLPTDRVQSFTGLLGIALALLPGRR